MRYFHTQLDDPSKKKKKKKKKKEEESGSTSRLNCFRRVAGNFLSRSLRSLNCAYLCPFASGRPKNYYVTCLQRRREGEGGREEEEEGGRCTRSANAPSINRDTTPTSDLLHPAHLLPAPRRRQPLLTDRIDLWGRCFDPKPKGLPILSLIHI